MNICSIFLFLPYVISEVAITPRQIAGVRQILWQWKTATVKHSNLTEHQGEFMANFVRATIAKIEERTAVPQAVMNVIKRKNEVALGRNLKYTSCGAETECGEPFYFPHIWGYGCWCYFGDDAGKGSGPVQNEMDEICKALSLCYRCAKIDSYYHDNDICHPGMQNYKVNFSHDLEEQGIKKECVQRNTLIVENNKGETNEFEVVEYNNCKVHTCCCETRFMNQLAELFFTGEYMFDKRFKHKKEGGFNHKDICAVESGPHNVACCGEYPSRKPFFIDSHMVCCESGKIQPEGTCVESTEY